IVLRHTFLRLNCNKFWDITNPNRTAFASHPVDWESKLPAPLRSRYLGFFACGQRLQQSPYLIQNITRLCCLEGKTQYSLGRELCPFLGILRYQFHQAPGINIGLAGEADMNLVALAI